jgi:hypothetical protein
MWQKFSVSEVLAASIVITPVNFYQTTQRNNPEGSCLHYVYLLVF